MRLDKFIANNTEYSRSHIRKLAKSGRIHVNQSKISDPSIKINPESDRISVDDNIISEVGNLYFMLNKPEGFVCANSDGQHPTVIDLLFDHYNCMDETFDVNHLFIADLQIVGRLDIDTTGLVLITNDGNWNHRVTAPSSHCPKRYMVEAADPVPNKAVEQFAKGVLLDGEKKKTQPAELELISEHCSRLTISEGKYHQVKRMFAALGNKVTKLHRESIGDIKLDPTLDEGQYRQLTPPEIESVY